MGKLADKAKKTATSTEELMKEIEVKQETLNNEKENTELVEFTKEDYLKLQEENVKLKKENIQLQKFKEKKGLNVEHFDNKDQEDLHKKVHDMIKFEEKNDELTIYVVYEEKRGRRSIHEKSNKPAVEVLTTSQYNSQKQKTSQVDENSKKITIRVEKSRYEEAKALLDAKNLKVTPLLKEEFEKFVEKPNKVKDTTPRTKDFKQCGFVVSKELKKKFDEYVEKENLKTLDVLRHVFENMISSIKKMK